MSTPRNTPASAIALFFAMGGSGVLIITFVLVVMSLSASNDQSLAQRFDESAVETSALVTERFTTTRRDSEGRRQKTYKLRVAFPVEHGRQVTVTETVSRRIYERYHTGQRITLWYLPDDHDRIELVRGSHARSGRSIEVIALVVGLVCLALLWRVGSWAVQGVQARRYGMRQEVVVAALYRTSIKINKRPRYRLTWINPQGEHGSSLLGMHSDFDGFDVGTSIVIYTHRSQDWWEGDVGPREGYRYASTSIPPVG